MEKVASVSIRSKKKYSTFYVVKGATQAQMLCSLVILANCLYGVNWNMFGAILMRIGSAQLSKFSLVVLNETCAGQYVFMILLSVITI